MQKLRGSEIVLLRAVAEAQPSLLITENTMGDAKTLTTIGLIQLSEVGDKTYARILEAGRRLSRHKARSN